MKALAPLLTREPPSAPATIGPFRKVRELVGFERTERGTTFIYLLDGCGHEVARRHAGRTGCYCEKCLTRDGSR